MRSRLTDAERRTFALRNAATWRDIREAAEDAFDASRSYRYYDGAVTHDCDDMTALARVTRAARKRDGVKWREDR
jgi:hypothetical protein